MSLQAELDAFMADVRTKVPAEVLAPIERYYSTELRAPGAFPNVPDVGERVADFDLPDATGKRVRLQDLLDQGPVVLSFYRGAWCPFCNLELRALQQALPALKAKGASLLAISPELPDYAMPLIEREQLAFPVLSDHGNVIARRLGLVFALEGEIRRISLEVFGVDLPKFNGVDSWDIPVPATFLLDRGGVVRMKFFDPEFRNRVEPQAIVDALDRI